MYSVCYAIHFTHAVPPQINFHGVIPILGIVHHSINLSFTIDSASPDVLPVNTVWKLRTVDANMTTLETGTRYAFSSDRRSLVITNLTHEDEGQYTITAANAAGSGSFAVNLDIEGKNNSSVNYSSCKQTPI